MKKYLEILRKCPLFHGIGDADIVSMLDCFEAEFRSYGKEERILKEGNTATKFGIVLSGMAQIVRVDYYGNRNILTNIEAAEIFGESFACAGIQMMPVDVTAIGDTKVVLMDARRIMTTCNRGCAFHNQLIYNLLKVVARKNLVFHEKLEVTSGRSTREKLMTYLLLQAKKKNRTEITIPYDRQELADYLEVDRSGLSAEISKLRKEGILECRKNQFRLLSQENKMVQRATTSVLRKGDE